MSFENWDRRRFLEFMGRGAVAVSVGPLILKSLGCATASGRKSARLAFEPIGPMSTDSLVLAQGLEYSVIAKWGDPINSRETFGSHSDFTAYFPSLQKKDDGLLWVNHEYLQPLFTTGSADVIHKKRRKSDVSKEQEQIGGSILRVRRNLTSGRWEMVKDDSSNRRITGKTVIPFAWDKPIAGARAAVGMVWNCAGGVTPWRTVLTCEEEYANFYGERKYVDGKPDGRDTAKCIFGWESVVDYPPEHYGWVVEVEPTSGKAKKLVAMGRFGHECATVRVARDGRCVVYSGEDTQGGFIFKFIAEQAGSLERGRLYVADTLNGHWIPLVWEENETLKQSFKDQTEVLVRAHEAALRLGATPQDRPEDIEIDPATGAIYVSLTNNYLVKNFVGSIFRIREKGGDPLSLKFESETFLPGGSSFACPDNLAFDPSGNLWMTSDMSGSAIGKDPYSAFGNNGLFFIPMSGDSAGQVFQVGSAPMDAEFTGPTFTSDGRTLFLSIQHPGEQSSNMKSVTSHWPEGGGAIPRSAVVAIQGPVLDAIMGVGGQEI